MSDYKNYFCFVALNIKFTKKNGHKFRCNYSLEIPVQTKLIY